jgi:HEAT repeat protein
MKTNLPKTLLLAFLLALICSAARAQTESELIATLQSGTAPVEKCAACQKLRLVGTAKAVPAIAAQLPDDCVSQAARFALEGIAAPEASAALREALGKTTGPLKSGVADSLGWKRDEAAVPLLKPLLADPDATVANAAAGALGRIASPAALATLGAARDSVAPNVRATVFEALLRCAESLLADGKQAQAKAVYETLAKASEPEHVRVAACAGLLRCAGSDALAQIMSALRGNDPAAQVAALQLAGSVRDPGATAVFSELIPNAPPALQVALLALLRTRGDVAAMPAVQAAARSQDSAVRIAALAAMGKLGDAGAVSALAEAATSREDTEQKVARQALVALRRGDVAGALVQQLNRASPAVQAEFIRALGARDEKSAVPALLQLARSELPATRKGALKALGTLADGSQTQALVELLAGANDSETREQVIAVFAVIAQRQPEGKGVDAEPIVRGTAGGEFDTRKALLQVCALFVSEPMRAALRTALKDSNDAIRAAAARAVCDAQDAALLPDLLAVARETPDASLRSLAIQGIVRMVAEETSGLSTEQRTQSLASAFELASRVEDKRQVLSGLPHVPNEATLGLARKSSADAAVKAEAEAAVAQIAQKLGLFHGPFIQDWLVCGPYRKAGAAGALAVFEVPFGPEIPGEAVQWKAVPRGEQMNLEGLFPGEDNCAAYLKAHLVAPADTDALLLLGSDDGVKAWLNGKVVHANNVDRGDMADQDKAPIRLAKGTNELMLKITQGGGGWSARARIVAPDGQAIPGLLVLPAASAPLETAQPLKPAPTPIAAKLPPRDNFKKLRLSDQFYAEGAYFGDFNRDGKLDIVAGPFWFEGQDFTVRHEYRAVQAYEPKDYSDNFLTYTGDCNGDGWTDIVCVPWPGKEGYWFENPAGQAGPWKKHLYYNMVGNESPVWGDVNGDGRPELLFNNEGFLGYAGPDFANPTQPWVFHAISGQDKRYQRYTHGVGFGDINGDKRTDVIEGAGWWEQAANLKAGQAWILHPFHFTDAGAQMLIYDVNGDGLADVVTAWHCHNYGLVWWEQVRKPDGAIDWTQHVILPPKPDLQSADLRVSQLHAFDLADINGDGVKDIVTGKRYWAHGPSGDPESDAPPVVLWFEIKRGPRGKVDFIPHLIDDDSGVGTQVSVVDLNGDERPDVVVANKKGIFIHLRE